MSFYKDIEDSLFAVIHTVLPDARVTFAFSNDPEPTTPHISINIRKPETIGMGEESVDIDTGYAISRQTYQTIVRFTVLGYQDDAATVSELASELDFLFNTIQFNELMLANDLAVLRKRPMERFQRKRDTKIYMCYQQDIYITYIISNDTDLGTFDTIEVGGTYYNAGREGNTIESTITVQYE